ncbi:MAG: Zn-ribbon domain-containing OB-fold protein [Candidatus Methanospirareceae archaeon]
MASTARFWRNLSQRYNLEGTHCKNCNSFFFPPRPLCPKCRRKGTIESYKFKGTGEVVTYTIVHQSPLNFNRQTPYVLAIIKLEEGPLLLSEVICEPHEIKIGMKVRAVFRKIGEEGEKGIIYYGTKFVPLPPFS